MTKRILAAALMLLAMMSVAVADEPAVPATADTTVQKPQAPYVTSIEEAKAKAAEGNKYILVDFYADW